MMASIYDWKPLVLRMHACGLGDPCCKFYHSNCIQSRASTANFTESAWLAACPSSDTRGMISRADVSGYLLLCLPSAMFVASRFGYDYCLISLGVCNRYNISAMSQVLRQARFMSCWPRIGDIWAHKTAQAACFKKTIVSCMCTCVVVLQSTTCQTFGLCILEGLVHMQMQVNSSGGKNKEIRTFQFYGLSASCRYFSARKVQEWAFPSASSEEAKVVNCYVSWTILFSFI